MTRKRAELGARAEKLIASMTASGATAAAITKALVKAGVTGVSSRTVGRRMRELRGNVAAPRVTQSKVPRSVYAKEEAAPAPVSEGEEPLPASPEAIPEDATLAQIQRWLERAERTAKIAIAEGDISVIGQMGRLTTSLLESKRRNTPAEKDDPGDSPDMQRVAARARAMLHRYIDQALGKVEPDGAK